ncbi:hypothetical protein O7627_26450 [Solwaraspora sp. WMMD1047]|uniref:hypothetical protein n=1 Tax=Solwaraspora sp. WMMD1047 TaxID=3016102 RepID=UPI0024163FF2|nr:hypothetical protein [Solwaraspora sp. WMMD1047]MDG4832820.1 hypothetical protein [Solwaraspora sp. WMMD1047]
MSGYSQTIAAPVGADRVRLLRLALRLDAVASAGLGAAVALAAPLLDGPLGAPTALLWAIGGFLVPFSVALWVIGSRVPANRSAVRTVIAVNAAWVVGSVLLVLFGGLDLTALGVAVVLGQAAAVAVLAELQYAGLRRANRS